MIRQARAYCRAHPYAVLPAGAVLTWVYACTGHMHISYTYDYSCYVTRAAMVTRYVHVFGAQRSDDFDFCISRYSSARRATQ